MVADRKSVLFVTHDLEEAIALSDRVVVLSAGPRVAAIAEFGSTFRVRATCRRSGLQPRFVELHAAIWHALKERGPEGP